MFDGMYAAAAGMEAQQQQLASIGNDLANLSTTGYKAERVGFRDLLYNQVNIAGTVTSVGSGAAAQSIGRNQSQGAIESTGNPLDLALEGPGYFAVKQPDGTLALTRDGALQVDARGQLTTAEGDLLDPPVTLPAGTGPSDVAVSPDGTVSVGTKVVGHIALVNVPAPDSLLAAGGNLFTPTAASGAPQPTTGASIQQGALESSNVDVGTEMTQMVSAQRSYQLESSAIQNENQMLSFANELVTQ